MLRTGDFFVMSLIMKKLINIVIAAIISLISINTAKAIECSNKVEILRLNIDRPKKNSILFPVTNNAPRFAIDPHENLWISNGNSIKLFSTDDGVNYQGKFIVKRGDEFAVSSNLLFVFIAGPYYYPKYQIYNIVGVVDVISGIDVYEKKKEYGLYEIKKSIHEKDSIVNNVYGNVHFINRDNQLVVRKEEGSEVFAIYLNKELEVLYKKKKIYLYKGEDDIYFDRDLVVSDIKVIPINVKYKLSILDAEEKVLNEYISGNKYDYIRNIYGEITFVENGDKLLQFSTDGKIENKIDISCINKNIFKGLYPNKLVGPNNKLYFSEKENGDLIIKYIDLKNKQVDDKGASAP